MKKYTRKQISEAIQYWQKQLNYLIFLESKSYILDELIRQFGKNQVMNVNQEFTLNNEICYKIFSILNKFLFDNSLGKIPIKCLSFAQIDKELQKIDLENNDSIRDNSGHKKAYGMYICIGDVTDESNLKDTANTLTYKDDGQIFINLDMMTNQTFIFSVCVLAHEMIHLFDKKYGEYRQLHILELQTNMKFDEHTTRTFKDKQNKAKACGLEVISTGAGLDFSKLNQDSINRMLSVLNEDETSVYSIDLPNIRIYKSGRILSICD